MRCKLPKIITFFVVILNVIALYYTWRLVTTLKEGGKSLFQSQSASQGHLSTTRSPNKHISKSVTIVLRQFELYENDVSASVESFVAMFPNIQVLVICDDLPYPPLDLLFTNKTSKNIKIVNLSRSLNVSLKDRLPIFMIKTKYVLFIPDSTRITSRQVIQSMITDISKHSNRIVSVLSSNEKNFLCLSIDLRVREWTVKYESIPGGTLCDSINGKHATLIETEMLKTLTDPFMLPFPEALYVQTAFKKAKIHVLPQLFISSGKPVLHSHHTQWRLQQAEASRRRTAYTQLAVKRVERETGTVEWFGCGRDTSRCFGAVLDSIPSYLYAGKWTPPCCLSHLRRTARHVLAALASAGVRHWLEAGSLLGAMRRNDILPWDHDVDVGVYRDDLQRLSILVRASSRSVTDEQGFVWEKATEGHFYRVHFSKTNRIHVNVFPFYSNNGTMVRDGWFTSHKNMEFPEHFLHPMSSIEFIGRQVPSPNNIRDFLELKFGKGAVENQEYPNPTKLKFPKDLLGYH